MNIGRILWLLVGIGSKLQVIASLSMGEIFVLLMAPIVLAREWSHMKRTGVSLFLILSVLVFCGCIVSCLVNHVVRDTAYRGLAATILLPCAIIVGHWMLRKYMLTFGWFFIGIAIGLIVNTFVFQSAVELGQSIRGGFDITDGPIYWILRLDAFLTAPCKGWYLNCPIVYSVLIPLFMAGFSMLTSSSGRSAALGALASAAIVLIGGRNQQTMRRIGRWFWALLVGAVIFAFVAKNVYAYAALHDWLGEESRTKYEGQTKGDSSMMALLLGGRFDSFCGLIACVDRPIVGFGPWAMDEGGYIANFLQKYGSAEDYNSFLGSEMEKNRQGYYWARRLIPCHSHITQFWCWYGIFGLVFWFYVIFVLVRFLKQDCWVVPRWFFWLAAGTPSFFWGIFFSPWSERIGGVLFVVACLMARAVRRRRLSIPLEMISTPTKRTRC